MIGPDGWKLVPVNPTLEMLQAGVRSTWHDRNDEKEHYAAMLAAAPVCPATDPVPNPLVGDEVEAVAFPAYGEMPFADLGAAVKAAQFGELQPYPFDPEFYPGHQIVGTINFNSLNRIVTWFVKRATTAKLTSKTEAREKAERRVEELESRYEDWKPIGEMPHESQIHRGVLFNFYRDDEDGTFWNGTWSQRRDADIWCSVVTASLNGKAHAALVLADATSKGHQP